MRDAVFPTFLLRHRVRETGVLDLETAIWHLTGKLAGVFAIDRRGLVHARHHADLVAFDPATVGDEELERVCDLPGGAYRLIGHSRGIEHVGVNGRAVRVGGADLELGPAESPGRLLRVGVS